MSSNEDAEEWERVIDVLRDMREERAERDLQAAIRLENLATFTMFKLSEGGK